MLVHIQQPARSLGCSTHFRFHRVARGLDLTRLFLLLCIYILAKKKTQREGSQCVLEEKTNKHEGQTAFFRA